MTQSNQQKLPEFWIIPNPSAQAIFSWMKRQPYEAIKDILETFQQSCRPMEPELQELLQKKLQESAQAPANPVNPDTNQIKLPVKRKRK